MSPAPLLTLHPPAALPSPLLCSLPRYAAPLHKVKTDDMLPIKLLTPFQVGMGLPWSLWLSGVRVHSAQLSCWPRVCGCCPSS